MKNKNAWKLNYKSSLFLYFLFFSTIITSEILLDGKLNEEEWKEARTIDTFYEVFPFSLNDVSGNSKILIQEDKKGIYFGFINIQPRETIRSNQHQRDQGARPPIGDQVGVTIDFDNDGKTAYRFSVNAGNSINDGTVINENEQNLDWDGDWLSATSISEEGWYAEIFIPWTITSMKSQEGKKRSVGLCFYRMLIADYKVQATCKGSPYVNKFLSVFDEIDFQQYEVSQIDFFPYITFSDDSVIEENDTKFGAEVFWKIDSSKQLNVTFNPDFGQVESDELVVNFSASETYYSDKRPFFAENQSMFEVQGYEMFYVINTRRIGAAPDYNCSELPSLQASLCNSNKRGISDIDMAVRYIHQGENLDFGFLGASEKDEEYSQGRDFYATKLRKTSKDLSIGYLGTYVERPILDRNATVHAANFEYWTSEDLVVSGVLMNSKVNEEDGYGFRVGYGYTPSKTFSGGIGLWYFDDKIDLSDMGYLWRNDQAFFSGRFEWKKYEFLKTSITRERRYQLDFTYETDSNGNKETPPVSLTLTNGFKNSSQATLKTFYRLSGRDTLITRKYEEAPFVKMPAGYGFEFEYMGPSRDFYQYMINYQRRKGEEYLPALGWNTVYDFFLQVSPSDFFSMSIFYQEHEEKDWLNWIQDNLLATYDMKQRVTVAGLNWFKGDRHELRVKAQMVAFTAREPLPFLADLNGNLNISPKIAVPSITLSDLAFQIRYRYELQPLSYLYVVYTKGGRIFGNDEEDNLRKLYRRPWEDPQSDTFTVKLRYRF
tara:strand:- start:11121 stop:13436 length:2316 start_codon:yes stop_codon:yes gene_type:complete